MKIDFNKTEIFQSRNTMAFLTVVSVEKNFVRFDLERYGVINVPVQKLEKYNLQKIQNETEFCVKYVERQIPKIVRLSDEQIYHIAEKTIKIVGKRFIGKFSYLKLYKQLRNIYSK